MLNRWIRGYRGLLMPTAGGGGGAPAAHAASHRGDGSDPISAVTSGINGLMTASLFSKLQTANNVDAAVTAAGTTQADATVLTKPISYVTAGNQATPNGVRLPAANTADVAFFVFNAISGASTVTQGVAVYPAVGDTILPNAVNVRDYVQSNMLAMYIPLGGGQWRAVNIPMKSDHLSVTASGTWYFYQVLNAQSGINSSGTINANSGLAVTAAAITTSHGQLSFTATTANNKILFPDNLAEAFWIGEGANRYLSIVSTDSTEAIVLSKNVGYGTPTVLTPAGTTQTLTWAAGINQTLSLASASGNMTLTLTNPVAGGRYKLKIIQHATTPRTLTFSPTVRWPGGVGPTISVGASAVDMVELFYDGTQYFGTFTQAFA